MTLKMYIEHLAGHVTVLRPLRSQGYGEPAYYFSDEGIVHWMRGDGVLPCTLCLFAHVLALTSALGRVENLSSKDEAVVLSCGH